MCSITMRPERSTSASCKDRCCGKGVTVPTADLMIAAVALAHDLTLVTHNTADFQAIPGLRLEDWLSP